MPLLTLKEEGSKTARNPKQESNSKEHPFWKEVTKDILQPFAPKIPTIAMHKCRQKMEIDLKGDTENSSSFLIHFVD